MDGITLSAEQIGAWQREIASARILPFSASGPVSPAPVYAEGSFLTPAEPDGSRNAGGRL
ncbi:MAG: hypothetical protein E5X34_15555 [Mesorhizobium sp.]|uniref:hypothetical protein n=1 Tax=Mesorhizobium sp. TaxID=1871066 RepID=UPI001207E6A9|nr:hypothetical protein [Mesorhizobium sp.]TIR22519.1 MAG: hypothetical protein E5X34_15555 [Mesorhizobium sp.]